MSVGAFAPIVACALLTWALAIAAPRLGWTDDGSDAPERKTQHRPVPLVGGMVVLCFVLATTIVDDPRHGSQWAWDVSPRVNDIAQCYAILGAFAVGLADDLASKGIRPAFKLAGQIAVAALCARATANGAPAHAIVAFAVALLAMNAFNTFDNADGAATSLGVLGVGAVAPILAAPLLSFLPFNLWIRRRAPDGSSTPFAYLGDSGSHLLGVLVALVPGAWPVLALPLADLARLSVVRVRRGSRPWIGDRRHLAHRLQARGLGPTAVAIVLLGIAAPSVMASHALPGVAWALPLGIAATLALYAAAVRWTPDVP